MIYKLKGSGSATHTVDTQTVTCSCMDFKFQHRDVHPLLSEKRYCKHLMQFKGEIGVLHEVGTGFHPKTQVVSVRPVGPYSHKGKHSRNVIQLMQEQIVEWMKAHPKYYTAKFEFCGSWRRGATTIGDIDLLISEASAFTFYHDVREILKRVADETLLDGLKKSAFVIEGIQVDMRVIPDESWAAALCHFTGPMEENIRLRKIAKEKGVSLSEYGLKTDLGVFVPVHSEMDIYNYLDQPYIAANKR